MFKSKLQIYLFLKHCFSLLLFQKIVLFFFNKCFQSVIKIEIINVIQCCGMCDLGLFLFIIFSATPVSTVRLRSFLFYICSVTLVSTIRLRSRTFPFYIFSVTLVSTIRPRSRSFSFYIFSVTLVSTIRPRSRSFSFYIFYVTPASIIRLRSRSFPFYIFLSLLSLLCDLGLDLSMVSGKLSSKSLSE